MEVIKETLVAAAGAVLFCFAVLMFLMELNAIDNMERAVTNNESNGQSIAYESAGAIKEYDLTENCIYVTSDEVIAYMTGSRLPANTVCFGEGRNEIIVTATEYSQSYLMSGTGNSATVYSYITSAVYDKFKKTYDSENDVLRFVGFREGWPWIILVR